MIKIIVITDQKHVLATKIFFLLSESALIFSKSYIHTIHLLNHLLQFSRLLLLGIHFTQQCLKLVGNITL